MLSSDKLKFVMGNDGSTQYRKKIENDINITWKKQDVNCPFLPREGQAAAVIGSRLYLFGGVIMNHDNDDEPVTESNELLVYDTKLKKWSKEQPSGSCPSPRSGASLTSVKKCLYLFGGLSQMSGWLNDFYEYNTVTKVWRKIDVSDPPSPRDKVQSVSINDMVYIFGGFGPVQDDQQVDEIILPGDEDDEDYEDMDELQDVRNCQDAANFTWSNQLYAFDTVNEEWSKVSVDSSKIPTPRAAHTITFIKEKNGRIYLYVFGGRDAQSRQNDLWKFDVSENKWEECKFIGCPPQPCSFHAATAVDHRLVVYGGRGVDNQHFQDLHIFDTELNQWLQPNVNKGDESEKNVSDHTPAVGLHSLCTAEDSIFLYGGSSDLDPATGTCINVFNDIYTLSINDVLAGGAIQMKETDIVDHNNQSVPDMLNLKPKNAAEVKDA